MVFRTRAADSRIPVMQLDGAKSKCLVISCLVSGIVGVVFVALGGLNVLGPIGSGGFIGSIAAGSFLSSIALAGIIWIAIASCRNKKQEKSNIQENIPIVLSKPAPTVSQEPEEKRKYDECRECFIQAALKSLKTKKINSIEFPNLQDVRPSVEEVFDYVDKPMPPNTSIEVFVGGSHVCAMSKKIPHVIFKKIKSRFGEVTGEMGRYVQDAEKGRKICKDHNLYLLYVPHCKQDDSRKDIIIQEKLELLEGGWQAQKACYQWAVSDPRLQPYMKELFRQLTIFICLMGLADVKYDNLQLMKNGQCALFDLDEGGAVTGLTAGRFKGHDGLFSMMPHEWVADFVKIAKKHLNADDFSRLKNSLPNLKERAEKRNKSRKRVAEFYNSQKVTFPTQPLVFNEKAFKKYDTKVRLFAEKTIESLNKQIAFLPHLSLLVGRKLFLSFKDSSYKQALESIFNSQLTKLSEMKDHIQEGLEALVREKYILSYKFQNENFYVVC